LGDGNLKNLIIVCEERFRQYGDFLAQLVSIEDKKDINLGIKEGTVVAQVWSEKEYISNAAQISSEQYLLFIGNSKLSKSKRFHMINKFSEYGMNYGWLGKQAAIFVDRVVGVNDYNSFIEYAKRNQSDINKFIKLKSDILFLPERTDGEDIKSIKELLNIEEFYEVFIVNTKAKIINRFKRVINKNSIEKQEYTCLVFVFYLKGLSQFLGLCEE
jgi:hypothetical protein